jgi:actin-like ATPase involved in cell morphogenesis
MSIDQAGPKRHALGVDFGTSNTVAVARWPDGRARPILIDGSPLLPSAVYAQPDGQLIVGRDAVHSARLDPARFEPNPKRRVDDGLVLLADREIPVVELITAVLGRVAEEWHRTVGPVPTDVTLTCPATWGATRRTLLAEAAARAGLHGARLVAEPVAAATYFAEVLGRDVPIGSVVVVHDFGAGTFDASVVARTAEGFEVLAVDGRDDIGGLDVDAAIVAHLGAELSDASAWRRLVEPVTVEERRAQRQLWDDVRVTKERLSRTQSADLVVPLLDLEVHLTRDELEKLARPVLDQTVAVTRRLLRWAELPEGRLAGVFLVGGASRIPLVATLLHRELGEAPVVIEQPELVVAEGSILADAALLASGPAAPGPTAELRLVFDRRAESETVVTSRAEIDPVRASGGSTATPAAAGASAGPLPAAGLTGTAGSAAGLSGAGSAVGFGGAAGSAAGLSGAAGSAAGLSGAISPAAGGAGVDDQETVRSRPDGSGFPPPAVDPWPHAAPATWKPDPEQTVASEPSWRVGPTPAAEPSWKTSTPSRETEATRRAAQAPSSPARPVPPGVSPSRPTSPARPSPDRSSEDRLSADRLSAERLSADRQPRAREPVPPASVRRPAARPPAAVRPRPRRHPGGFVRLLQVLFSIVLLIAAPVAAMVFAYSYGTGEPLQVAATQLVHQLRELLGIRIS